MVPCFIPNLTMCLLLKITKNQVKDTEIWLKIFQTLNQISLKLCILHKQLFNRKR